MSQLSERQSGMLVEFIRRQAHYLTLNPAPIIDIHREAENIHSILNGDVQLPYTDRPMVTGWYCVNPELYIPMRLVDGSNLGGLPNGSFVEPNGHLLELICVDGVQQLRPVAASDYMAE